MTMPKKNMGSPFRVVNIPFSLVSCPSQWFIGVEVVCRHQHLISNDVGERPRATCDTVLNGGRHPLPRKRIQ
jgi:hypothetical protein